MNRARACLFLVVLAGCGGEPPPAPKAPSRPPAAPRAARPAPQVAPRAMPGHGSSDGMTCDEARDAHGDEVAIGQRGGDADLSSGDFAKILNDGRYLGECDVPSDVAVDLCAAVKEGRALGVTVALTPSDPDKERCVATKVRELGFPIHKKLDVVRTRF